MLPSGGMFVFISTLLPFPGFPPSPLTFALVEPEAQTHFSFSIFFMNNDIISKNCWRGKGLWALSGFDNTRLPHLSLSLWTIFGRCCMSFGKTVVADGEEVIMVWCWFFLCLLPKRCSRDAGRGGRWGVFSPPSSLSFHPPFSLCHSPPLFSLLFLSLSPSSALHLLYNFSPSSLTLLLSASPAVHPPLYLFYFITHLPPISPFSLSFSLSLSTVLSGLSGSN